MKTLKDVFEIEERDIDNRIIVHQYDRSTRWNDVPVVLHIVDRDGKIEGRDIIGKPAKHHIHLTKCNRVAEHWDSGNQQKVNLASEGKNGFKFCSRCGTKDDFFKVIKDWNKTIEDRSAKYKAEQDRKEQEWKEAYERIKTATRINGQDLMHLGYSLKVTEHETALTYTKEINGRTYKFTVNCEEVK